MSTTLIVIVLAAISFFAGIVLILTMGYLETEEKRAMEAKTRQAAPAQLAARVVALPRFFGPPQDATSPIAPFDDSLVSRLENYVRLEQTMVAQFVDHPSVDNLYRHPDSTPGNVH